MTQYAPTFSPREFELRNYTNLYLTEAQTAEVEQVETRVSENLDFVAQMLGWQGPNYWSSLARTVSEKRQLLSGTYGVYNSYVIPKIYEIRNWDDTIVVDRIQFLQPGRQTFVERIVLGDDVYRLRSVSEEGDKYVISVGTLPQSFYDQVAANVPLKVDVPTYRPAPFQRTQIGVSGDNSFICSANNSNLILYPAWDIAQLFPYRFPILFAGAVYYFNQPVYLQIEGSSSPNVTPEYDNKVNLWYLTIPVGLTSEQAGIEASLVWSYASASLMVKLQPWRDPSDWGSINVLNNFRGVWNNKGGFLPFNLVFDSLSIHGFNEQQSLYLNPIEREVDFNLLIEKIYSQSSSVRTLPPNMPSPGDLWWNSDTGVLSAWFPNDTGCGYWVQIDYREQPTVPSTSFVFPDVASFSAGSGNLSIGTSVTILDISGLSPTQNVIGVQGTLGRPGSMTLHRADSSVYWTPTAITYANVDDFAVDALLLPFKVPVTIFDATGLSPSAITYSVNNLDIVIAGDYEVILTKYYTNMTWEISTNSVLQYIANTSLFGAGHLQGEMWWDFANPDPNTRAAEVFYQSAWVSVNLHNPSGPAAPVLDMSTLLFFADGVLLTQGVEYLTENYRFTYRSNAATGKYTFSYTPVTFLGKVNLPKITISDSLTTTYVSDVSEWAFGGIDYVMSPNVYDAESPLRVWKAQDLQVAETLEHLAENNYINPLQADLNNGPGPENWEKYFIRLPLDYGRNEDQWQRVALTCQNFGYWGSSIEPEFMRCPPEQNTPAIYEELFLYGDRVPDYTYVYCEPYLYSNIAYSSAGEPGSLRNSALYPANDERFDQFDEAQLINYDPLHNRQADVVSAVGSGFGDWIGDYVNINPCVELTGFYTTDLLNNGLEPVAPPIWDASIYKYPPTCQNNPESYTVDANHYKVSYSYFVADASTAEDPFFDVQQEISWRYPVEQPRTGYLTPR